MQKAAHLENSNKIKQDHSVIARPAQSTEEMLREPAPNADIIFERLAVTPTQIRNWRLPTPQTKKSDSGSKTLRAESVELDAIEPEQLRQLVRDAIEQHLPPDQFAVLKAAEENERLQVAGLVGMIEINGGRAMTPLDIGISGDDQVDATVQPDLRAMRAHLSRRFRRRPLPRGTVSSWKLAR